MYSALTKNNACHKVQMFIINHCLYSLQPTVSLIILLHNGLENKDLFPKYSAILDGISYNI